MLTASITPSPTLACGPPATPMPAPKAKIRWSVPGLSLTAVTLSVVPPMRQVRVADRRAGDRRARVVPRRLTPTPMPTPVLPPNAMPPPTAMISVSSDASTVTLPPIVPVPTPSMRRLGLVEDDVDRERAGEAEALRVGRDRAAGADRDQVARPRSRVTFRSPLSVGGRARRDVRAGEQRPRLHLELVDAERAGEGLVALADRDHDRRAAGGRDDAGVVGGGDEQVVGRDRAGVEVDRLRPCRRR